VSGIADPSEGLTRVEDKINLHIDEVGEELLIGGNAIRLGPGNREVIITDSISSYSVSSVDFLIFSMSKSAQRLDDANLMNPAYDACIEIIDPAEFVRHLTKSIPGQPALVGVYEVQYTPSSVQRNVNTVGMVKRQLVVDHFPFVHKDRFFEPQQEVRAVWQLPWERAKPFSVGAPRAIELIK